MKMKLKAENEYDTKGRRRNRNDSLTATTVGAIKHGSTLPANPIFVYLQKKKIIFQIQTKPNWDESILQTILVTKLSKHEWAFQQTHSVHTT